LSFYSDFSEHYNTVFPFNETVYTFLKSYFPVTDSSILDLGCGTGTYCGRLAGDGYKAIGIDLELKMIEHARIKYPKAHFHCMNIKDTTNLNTIFDGIYCIGNTLAHLKFSELEAVLHIVNRCLCKGGIWIFQVMNWDYILKHDSYKFKLLENSDKSTQFQREYLSISKEIIDFKVTLTINDEILFSETSPLYPVQSIDYIQMHHKSQFKLLNHFADFDKVPYRPDSDTANIFIFRTF
jgi:SAM-dependent methyltransferase